MKIQILTTVLTLWLIGIGAEAQEEASGFRAGPNMAVQEASLKDGFRLTDKAKEIIGVKTKALSSKPYVVPLSALVHYGDKLGVYRLRDGWFKLIEIQKNNKGSTDVSLDNSEFKDGDQIAIEGVALLRVSEMDAFGGEE